MERILRITAVVLIVFCLLLCSSATPARADSEGAGTVTASALNLRSEASTSSSVLTCLPRGSVVVITGRLDGWYQVAYKGYVGYMSADYLEVSSSADADFGDGTVTANAVNLRSGPGTDYSVVGSRDKGSVLSVTGVSDEWYKVDLNGSAGYIRSDYLSLGTASDSQTGTTSSSSVSGTGVIRGTGVRLRSGPSTSHSILTAFDTGATLNVTGESGDWYKVDYNGTEGYVYKTYLSLGGSADSSASDGVTAMSDTSATVISAVHFRKGPDTSYSSMQVLSAGTGVTITGETEKWYRVSYDGSEGYIFKTYLTTGAYSASSSSSEGERIVSKAKEYLGVPYVYGGSSPSGFDCSGFVYYVFRQCGYSITRTATTQNGDGYQVSRSDLRPGDIIIFYNSAKTAIGHSGIYIGNGQFIHASSSGGRVMISDLSSSYYDTHFYSARRVAG